MATAATPLLAGFDFDFAPSPHTPADVPIASLPLTRPPTPDPRHPFRPHLQRRPQDCYNHSPLPREQHKHARRKPPALSFTDRRAQAEAAPLYASTDTLPHTFRSNQPHTAFNPFLPLPPSTPSPKYGHTAPSLSSSGTTIQSSPTSTPSGERPGFRSEQDQRLCTGQSQWSASDRKLVLKRAKRLPHDNPGLWEVHAVVHVSGGREQQQQQQVVNSKLQHHEPDTSYFRAFEFPSTAAEPTDPANTQPFMDPNQATGETRAKRSERGVRFLGISSESVSREGGLRKAPAAESSTFSLSNYQFPPPPAPWHSPATVHYRGASFDLVNPHTSLLLSPPDLETPAEIEGLLDDYFDDDPMPRTLYADAGAARRDILRLGEDVRAAPGGAAEDPSPVSSETERSDPFALTLSDSGGEEESAHEPQGDDSALDSTVDGILAGYDYTRVAPPPSASDEATLRALEGSGPSGAAGRASATSSWLESQFAQGLGAPPSTSRTYGDTNVLLGIGHPEEAVVPQMMPAPSRSTTLRESDFGRHSAEVSLHDGNSLEPAIPDMWSSNDLPEQRRGQPEQCGLTQPSFGVTSRRESVYEGFDEGADWVTDREPTMGYQDGTIGRPSEESYANTSHYSEQNRFSAFTDVDLHSSHENSTSETPVAPDDRRQAATHDRTNSSDVRKASEYLFRSARDKAQQVYRSHRDKVVQQELEASLLSGVPIKMSKSRRHAERHRLERYRNQRNAPDEELGITNDAELEQLRQRNPGAVRMAVDNAAEMMRRQGQAAGTGIRRVRNMFRNSIHDLIPNNNRPETATELANLDHRGLISAVASSNGHRSGLAWSETSHTFRTVRDSSSIIAGLPGSHFDPVFGTAPPIATPPTAMTTGPRVARNTTARAIQPGDRQGASTLAKGKRRAAMSGQTELRPFEISGSPTSNIQGAFTDRELVDSEHRWRTHPPPAHRAQNMSGLLPQYSLRTSRPGDQDRMLIRPDEKMTQQDRRIQVQISKHYLYRCLLFPPALLMYTTGRLDHLILERTHGRITRMGQDCKDDAAKFAMAGVLGWLFLIVCIVCVVALSVKSLQ